MFLFLDIENYLHAKIRSEEYLFPFRQENLQFLLLADQLNVPQLLIELDEYLNSYPAKRGRYQQPASELACKYAMNCSNNENYLESVKYYQHAERYYALDEISTGEYGIALIKSGEIDKGKEILNIFEKIPARLDYLNYIVNYAELLKKSNSCEKAMAIMQSYSELKPDNENFWILYTELESLCSKKTPTMNQKVQGQNQMDALPITRTEFPKLTIISGIESGKTIFLSGKVKIGRGDNNIIKLNDRKVSRHHASLDQIKNGWEIIDANSSNGIFINGMRINNKAILNNGDLLLIGETQMVFSIDSGHHRPVAKLLTCPKCNNIVVAGVLFCGSCGEKLD